MRSLGDRAPRNGLGGGCVAIRTARNPSGTPVEESFAFLLEREPRESILRRFDLPVIGRYFPEYEVEVRRRLGG